MVSKSGVGKRRDSGGGRLLSKTAMASADAADLLSRFKRLAEHIHAKQLQYISNGASQCSGNLALQYVLTPDMVSFYNHMHDVIRSSSKKLPLDVCTETGGFMCTNVSALNSVDSNVFNLYNNYNIRVSTGGSGGVGNDNDSTLNQAVRLLDSIQLGDLVAVSGVQTEYLGALSELNDTFTDKLKEYQADVDKTSRDLMTTRRALAACTVANNASDELKQVLATVEQLRTDNARLSAELVEREIDVSAARTQLKANKDEMIDIQRTLDAVRQRLADVYESELSDLANEVRAVELGSRAYVSELKQLMRRNQASTTELIASEAARREAGERQLDTVADLEARLHESRARLEELTGVSRDLASCREELADTLRSREHLEGVQSRMAEGFESELRRARELIVEHEQRAARLEEELRQARKEAAAASRSEDEAATLRAEITRLTAEVLRYRKDAELTERRYGANDQLLRERVNELTETVRRLERDREHNESAKRKWTAQWEAANKDFTQKLKYTTDAFNAEREALRSDRASLAKENAGLNRSLDEARQQLADAKRLAAAANVGEMKRLRHEADDAKRKLAKCEEMYAAAKERRASVDRLLLDLDCITKPEPLYNEYSEILNVYDKNPVKGCANVALISDLIIYNDMMKWVVQRLPIYDRMIRMQKQMIDKLMAKLPDSVNVTEQMEDELVNEYRLTTDALTDKILERLDKLERREMKLQRDSEYVARINDLVKQLVAKETERRRGEALVNTEVPGGPNIVVRIRQRYDEVYREMSRLRMDNHYRQRFFRLAMALNSRSDVPKELKQQYDISVTDAVFLEKRIDALSERLRRYKGSSDDNDQIMPTSPSDLV